MKTRSILSAMAIVSAMVAAPAMAQGTSTGAADNTNAKADPAFNTWMRSYSEAHSGRISRQAYMDEAGRRWDAMDKQKRGLTADEINTLYGYDEPSPGQVKRGTSETNPTGTEKKGQSGGK
jgi:hypothetical protein